MALVPGLRSRAVFVDTSAFYGYVDPHDQWHEEATRLFLRTSNEGRLLYTSNLVVAESHNLILYRMGRSVAWDWLLALDEVNLVFQREQHHQRLRDILRRYARSTFSYTDAFSFAAMEELGISTAFTFDGHFREYGWDILA